MPHATSSSLHDSRRKGEDRTFGSSGKQFYFLLPHLVKHQLLEVVWHRVPRSLLRLSQVYGFESTLSVTMNVAAGSDGNLLHVVGYQIGCHLDSVGACHDGSRYFCSHPCDCCCIILFPWNMATNRTDVMTTLLSISFRRYVRGSLMNLGCVLCTAFARLLHKC